MSIIDMNDIKMGDGYYDENNVWQRTKYCIVDCGDKCTCKPPNGIYVIDYSFYEAMPAKTYLDPFTFGNSKAATTLVDILNEIDSEKVTQKVSGFIVRYHSLIKHVEDIKDPTTRSIVGYMFIEKINKSTLEVPDKVKSFMKNVVIGKIKDKLINL